MSNKHLPYNFFLGETPDGGPLETDLLYLLNEIKPDILRYLTKGYVVDGMEIENISGLTADLTAGTAFVYGNIVKKKKVSHTFPNGYTYIFLSKGGIYAFNTSTTPPTDSIIVRVIYGLAGTLTDVWGGKNLFLGYNSGLNNTVGTGNIFIGDNAGKENTTGKGNTVIGIEAGTKNTIGGTLIGFRAGKVTTGNYNTFIGHEAGEVNTTGVNNTIVGCIAGTHNVDGEKNTLMGYAAGNHNIEGTHNTYIGHQAGYSNIHGLHNVFLGAYAGTDETGSYTLLIDSIDRIRESDGRTKGLIYGTFAADIVNQQLTINGALTTNGALITNGTLTVSGKTTINDALEINGLLNQSVSKTPASASDTGTTGDIAWDINYVYVCVATDTWKRALLSSW